MRSLWRVFGLLFLSYILAFISQATYLNRTVYPHIQYRREIHHQAQIEYLKITNYRKHFHLRAAIPNSGIGYLEKLKTIVAGRGGVAGINANFYDPKTKLPIGLLIKDWEVLSSNYGRRAALTLDLFDQLEFTNPSLSVSVKTPGNEIEVDFVNCPLIQNKIILYTPEYKSSLILNGKTMGQFTEVRIKEDMVIRKQSSTYIAPAKRDYYLLLASGQAAAKLENLGWGDKTAIKYEVSSSFNPLKMAVSAGPMLVRDGQVVLDPSREDFDRYSRIITGVVSRSAVGVTPDGSLILLVVLENGVSPGMDLKELSQFLIKLGISDAINMDGGGSSTIVFREGTTWHTIGQNNPIAVGLVLIPKRGF